MKKIVTEQDLKDNPDLVKQGIKEGDEIEIPEPSDFENNDDTGGSTPPPNKGRG